MDFVHSFATDHDYAPGSSISRHGGCLTCKKRHKKCDEQRPRCGNCTRLNLGCKQPDLFRASRLSRSHPRKNLHVNSGLGHAANPNSILTADENDEAGMAPITSSGTSSLSMNLSQWMTAPHATQSPSIEDHLRQHYVERLSSILINIDGPTNTLRSISFPRMVTSLMLTNALYATSARHLFIYEGRAEYQIASLEYYNKASCELRSLLNDLGSGLSIEQRELMLLTSVFLCKYEIISGEVKNWRPHLRGLQKMFSLCQRNGIKFSEEIVSYIQSFVAYHWYIAGITRTERLSFSSEDAKSDEEMESQLVLSNRIDPYMGFSGRFISVLNSVAQIIMLDFTKGFDMGTIMQIAMKTVELIKSDPRQFEVHMLSSGITSDMFTYLSDIASGYRHALIVYLHIILEKLVESDDNDARALQFLLIRNLLPCSKKEAISACLKDVLRVPEHTSAAIGSTPLLFIVASETTQKTEFDTAFNLLMRLWTRSCLGNTGVALDFLRQIKEANFQDWRQALKLRKWDLIVS
ncbi:hypothetical protein N7456_010834 [Penicillium angulare]|uniref:Zn(2)-C6 fungal-type domain-containing protein n=1 Tax=Penicillium angulare TaxID=116970 RepID=A0A9W9ESK7_9EURO|nr:hypothetical protein N7456_010834 [Penicillium angulare]